MFTVLTLYTMWVGVQLDIEEYAACSDDPTCEAWYRHSDANKECYVRARQFTHTHERLPTGADIDDMCMPTASGSVPRLIRAELYIEQEVERLMAATTSCAGVSLRRMRIDNAVNVRGFFDSHVVKFLVEKDYRNDTSEPCVVTRQLLGAREAIHIDTIGTLALCFIFMGGFCLFGDMIVWAAVRMTYDWLLATYDTVRRENVAAATLLAQRSDGVNAQYENVAAATLLAQRSDDVNARRENVATATLLAQRSAIAEVLRRRRFFRPDSPARTHNAERPEPDDATRLDRIAKSVDDIKLAVTRLQLAQPKPDIELTGKFASECVICLDAPRHVLLLPCRHLATCERCIVALNDQCPVCRQAVERSVNGIY